MHMPPTKLLNMIRILNVFFFLLLIPTTLLAEGISQEQGKAILEELKAIKRRSSRNNAKGLSKKLYY